MTIYSGTSNPALAIKLSQRSKSKLSEVQVSRFENDECRVRILDKPGRKTAVLQSFSIPVDIHIIEFCLIADALHRLGASEITAIILWLGYSKQDKIFRLGESLSIEVIAKIIQTAGISQIITLDLHNPQSTKYFQIPISNLSMMSIFVEFAKNNLSLNDSVVVCPDTGGEKIAANCSKKLNTPLALLTKTRNLETGEVSILDIRGDVSNKDVFIFEDMIASGSTIHKSVEYLKKRKAKRITIFATHHLYLPGVQKKLENSSVNRIIVSDSIQKPKLLKTKTARKLWGYAKRSSLNNWWHGLTKIKR